MKETARIIGVKCSKKSTGNVQALMLQKSSDSKNPGAMEFPGGKLFDLEFEKQLYQEKSLEEQKRFRKLGAIKEFTEETQIAIQEADVLFLGIYTYKNTATGKETKVHVYIARIFDDVQVAVDETLTSSGESEDKHSGFEWISIRGYREKNENKEGDSDGFISNNSKVDQFERRIRLRLEQMKVAC